MVAEFVHAAKHVGPADLAGSRLISSRNIGDLDMRDQRHELLHAFGDVTLGDLHMVDVELQAQAITPDRLDERRALSLGIEEIARHVAVG